ncbi:MAG: hypothetical protein KKB51_14235 [Candidatus Riflebacteria bacterium]|nr:hypothetical protein [Candidatus Riflebacteria bacterium]
MKIKCSLLLIAVIVVSAGSATLFAQDAANTGSSKGTPWLEGVTIGEHPTELSPVLPMKIYLENGEAIPATLTEDVPITLVADTAIFDPAPPVEYNGVEIPNPLWVRNAAVSWFFIDWETNKNTSASSTQQLALNQMVVTPVRPTGKGAITCHIGRKMRYDLSEPGKTKGTFANSSVGQDVRVLDITPPTCGLEISVKGGRSGTFWVAENPPNKYPLPKLADVYFSGALVNELAVDEILAVQGLQLGLGMVVTPERAAISVPADAVLNIKVNGEDNYKLDTGKLKYGICSGAGGEPTPISAINSAEIKLSDLKMPDNPYLYVDATDLAGNRQVLFVPLKIK